MYFLRKEKGSPAGNFVGTASNQMRGGLLKRGRGDDFYSAPSPQRGGIGFRVLAAGAASWGEKRTRPKEGVYRSIKASFETQRGQGKLLNLGHGGVMGDFELGDEWVRGNSAFGRGRQGEVLENNKKNWSKIAAGAEQERKRLVCLQILTNTPGEKKSTQLPD